MTTCISTCASVSTIWAEPTGTFISTSSRKKWHPTFDGGTDHVFRTAFLCKGKKVALCAQCDIIGAEGYAETVLKELVSAYGEPEGICKIRVENTLPEFYAAPTREEGYAITVTEDGICLYGETDRARIYAAVTLLQMANHEGLYTGRLYDAPDCAFRGYRANLPSRRGFEDFYRMVDTLAYYKYNALSLEIGGAMEYKRHPKINELACQAQSVRIFAAGEILPSLPGHCIRLGF